MRSIYLDDNNILCVDGAKIINPFTDPSEVGFYLSDHIPRFFSPRFVDFSDFGSVVEKELLKEIESIDYLISTSQLKNLKTNIQGQSLCSLQKQLEQINHEIENNAINGNHLAIVADRYHDFAIGSYINAAATPHIAWLAVLVEIYKDFLFIQQQLTQTQTTLDKKEKKLADESKELKNCHDAGYVASKLKPIKDDIAQLKRDKTDFEKTLQKNSHLSLLLDNSDLDTKDTVFEDIFAVCGFLNKRAVSMLQSFKTIVFA